MARRDRTFSKDDLVRFFANNLTEEEKQLVKGEICGIELETDVIAAIDKVLNDILSKVIPFYDILLLAIASAVLTIGTAAIPIVEAAELSTQAIDDLRVSSAELEQLALDF